MKRKRVEMAEREVQGIMKDLEDRIRDVLEGIRENGRKEGKG